MGFASMGRDVLISRHARLFNVSKISVGDHSRIDDFCVLSGGAGISIGRYVHLGNASLLYGGTGIEMEDFTCLSSRCAIYSVSDDPSGESMTNPTVPEKYRGGLIAKPVILRKHSAVGTGSTILPGVELEEGAGVCAHSLVTKSCKAWTIYFGSPAKPIKKRSRKCEELAQELLQSRLSD